MACLFQFQKFQITEVIFCVIAGIPQNELIDLRDAALSPIPYWEKKAERIFFRPAFFMDTDIGQSIETEDDRGVFLPDSGSSFDTGAR